MSLRWLTDSRFTQNPREATFVQDPSCLYRELHRHPGPLWWVEYDCWCLADHAAVNAVLRDRRFARVPPPDIARPAWPPHLSNFERVERWSLLALEPPTHTAIRQTVNKAFVTRAIRQLAPLISQLCHAAVDTLLADNRRQPSAPVDLIAHYATPIPLQVITHMLGVPVARGPDLLAWSRAMVRVYTGQQSQADEQAADAAAAAFEEYLRTLIDARRRTPQDDLLATLCLPGDSTDTVLSDAQIISLVVLLLNAGHEATVHQIGNAVYRLLREPRWISLLYGDPAAADALVEECLRLDAPLHMFTRRAQQPLTLAPGVNLAAGESVSVLLGAANTDPARFDNSYAFAPERPDAGHLSLGAGLHFCLGAVLARLEIRIALSVLFQRLPEIRLAATPQFLDLYHFHGLESLPVLTGGDRGHA